MSIFSKIRSAKKAANEHKRSTSIAQASSKAEGKKPVYHHVPTHAAQDARIASSHGAPDALQRIQEQQRKSRLMPRRTGSDMDLQQGNKMPLKQRTAGDLSIQSAMGQRHNSMSTTSLQQEDFEVPNPYGFHPHGKRGSTGSRNSRRNSVVSSKGKSPLSNTLTGW